MLWGLGSSWGLGSLWGLTSTPVGDTYCKLAAEVRPLEQMDRTVGNRQFRDLLCVFGRRVDLFDHVVGQCIDAIDIDTATGEMLDFIGAQIGLAREGYDDDRYRELLKVWQLCRLPHQREEANWTGTSNNILAIARAFAPTGGQIVLTNIPPYALTLSVPGVPFADIGLLFRFICKALYAGVLGQTSAGPVNGSVWGSVHGPVINEGYWGSFYGPTGAPLDLVWGATFTTGTGPAGC